MHVQIVREATRELANMIADCHLDVETISISTHMYYYYYYTVNNDNDIMYNIISNEHYY